MHKKIELLAPGGDIDAIRAAIIAGADAIYCGLDNFNARKRAANISFEQLNQLLVHAHAHNCQIFLTLNILILERELNNLYQLLNKLANSAIDGVIVQDIGLFHMLKRDFPTLAIHASTQVTTHNEGQLAFYKQLGAERVNLSRELSIDEITALTAEAHRLDMATEVFVHGSNCIGFSGLCYFSSVHGGASGNRGRCSQPCRDEYQETKAGKAFPFNLKDNSAFDDLEALANAGVDSLKVEGRIKKPHYVYSVIGQWRKRLDAYYQEMPAITDKQPLQQVFNRDFTNGYLKGEITRDMFIDNPMDNAPYHLANIYQAKNPSLTSNQALDDAKQSLYDTKTVIIQSLEQKLAGLPLVKTKLNLIVEGKLGKKLIVKLISDELQINKISLKEFSSASELILSSQKPLNLETLNQHFNGINSDTYSLAQIDITALDTDLFIPYRELTFIRQSITTWLNKGREAVNQVNFKASGVSLKQAEQRIRHQANAEACELSTLSVLIDNSDDIKTLLTCKRELDSLKLYYQLPNALACQLDKLIKLFNAHQDAELIPYFPAVLIGEDYQAAKQLLHELKPKQIITNNTGVAWLAYQMDIDWVAGPEMNICNSQSMEALKQTFNCSGVFVSNELSKNQIEQIRLSQQMQDSNFELHYRLLSPSLLLSSRQCLFHQVAGCKKQVIDSKCLPKCRKHADVINIKDKAFIVDKQAGSFNGIYSKEHKLNLDILDDLPNSFASYMLDFTRIKTNTRLDNKAKLVKQFNALLSAKHEELRLEESKQQEIIQKGLAQAESVGLYRKSRDYRQAIETELAHFHNPQYQKGI